MQQKTALIVGMAKSGIAAINAHKTVCLRLASVV